MKLLSVLAFLFSIAISAQPLSIKVSDKNGQPITSAVVTLKSNTLNTTKVNSNAEMAQRNRQFDPHILIVQQGSNVSFPNYDNMKHHIYSFSDTKRFEMEVIQGVANKPELFDKAGVVELGCNVHDWMQGYIYVSASPYFSSTNETGSAIIEVPQNGNYELTIWHPRIDNEQKGLTRSILVDDKVQLTVQVDASLLSSDLDDIDIDDFEDY